MTPDQASRRITAFASRNPMALLLARMLSMAAIAEPVLIRNMRIQLVPGSCAADEADLWFSNLVQSRSPSGLIFFPEIAQGLSQGLTPKHRTEAWNLISEVHSGSRYVIRIEEELAYLGLDPEANAARIEMLLQTVLGALAQGRSELANWARRALPRLPAPVRGSELATALSLVANVHTGRPSTNSNTPGVLTRMPPWISRLLPTLGRISLKVELLGRQLILGPVVKDSHGPQTRAIEVPDTPTIPIEVRWTSSGGSRSEMLFLQKSESARSIDVDGTTIELVTLANETWTLQQMSTSSGPRRAVPVSLRAYSDGNAVALRWRAETEIDGCLGFSLHRRRLTSGTSDKQAEEDVILSRRGFQPANESIAPTTQWPVQRFSWIDLPTPQGSSFSYRVVPLVGTPQKLVPLETMASNWTAFMPVGPMTGRPIQIHVNRALDSLNMLPGWTASRSGDGLGGALAEPGNPARKALGGELLTSLLSLLEQAIATGSIVYVAMFNLEDPEILDLLSRLGPSANVMLSSGVVAKGKPTIQARVARQLRRAGVTVFERGSLARRVAHNKFMVICDGAERPMSVWTGNTTWSSIALCARSNVAVTVHDGDIAAQYLNYWKWISLEPKLDTLRGANALQPPVVPLERATLRAFFTPNGNRLDLQCVSGLIQNARQGILFLLSEPGTRSSVLATISAQTNVYKLGATRSGPSLTLFRDDEVRRLAGRALALPLLASLPPQSRPPRLPLGTTLQTRMIVIDPMGSHPVVLIGSHAFGERGSQANEENFLVIENDPETAQRCAAHVDRFCQHFRLSSAIGESKEPAALHPLQSSDEWQPRYFQLPWSDEIRFWMGEDLRTPQLNAPPPANPPPAAKPARRNSSPRKRKTQTRRKSKSSTKKPGKTPRKTPKKK